MGETRSGSIAKQREPDQRRKTQVIQPTSGKGRGNDRYRNLEMFAGGPSKAKLTIFELEALDRALTDDESAMLERALRRLGPKRDLWRWSAKEDRKLILLIKKRSHALRPKPFVPNDEVQRIAKDLGRSYLSVLKRIQRLRDKHGLAKQPRAYGLPSARTVRTYQRKLARPDLDGMVRAKDALLILQKRCPRVSKGIMDEWRVVGGGPPFITYRGSAEWRGAWYSEKGLAKFPVEQIIDEAKSRRMGWVFCTMRMDPDRDCPNATSKPKR